MAFGTGWQSSEPFKFIVDDRPVYIHRDLVSGLSKPLDGLINGKFREAQDNEAPLHGVDYDTFIRFVQWAYSGNYLPAEPISETVEEGRPQDESQEIDAPVEAVDNGGFGGFGEFTAREHSQDEDWGWGSWRDSKKKKKKSRFAPHTAIERQPLPFSQMKFLESEDVASPPQPRRNDPHTEDFTNLLLSHVKLYEFAEQKDIGPLKRYALTQLHGTLNIFDVTSSSAKQLLPMIMYAYENTPHLSGQQESLRLMISKYVQLTMKELVAVEEFEDLLQNADFARDFRIALRDTLGSDSNAGD